MNVLTIFFLIFPELELWARLVSNLTERRTVAGGRFMKRGIAVLILAIMGLGSGPAGGASAATAPKIHWGNDVPRGWNGAWPADLRTVPERTAYARTTSSLQLLEYIDALRWKSELVHVFSMYASPLGRTCPVLVLASPRIVWRRPPPFPPSPWLDRLRRYRA